MGKKDWWKEFVYSLKIDKEARQEKRLNKKIDNISKRSDKKPIWKNDSKIYASRVNNSMNYIDAYLNLIDFYKKTNVDHKKQKKELHSFIEDMYHGLLSSFMSSLNKTINEPENKKRIRSENIKKFDIYFKKWKIKVEKKKVTKKDFQKFRKGIKNKTILDVTTQLEEDTKFNESIKSLDAKSRLLSS